MVIAGTFHALRIEAEGEWSAVPASAVAAATGAGVGAPGASTASQPGGTAATVIGRTRKTFWYVPEVKRWAKMVEEYYDPDGVRYERAAEELERFQTSRE